MLVSKAPLTTPEGSACSTEVQESHPPPAGRAINHFGLLRNAPPPSTPGGASEPPGSGLGAQVASLMALSVRGGLGFRGPLSTKHALTSSRNIPAVWLSSMLREPNLYEFLQGLGVPL